MQMSKKESAYLIDRYYEMQKHRIAMGNQIYALIRMAVLKQDATGFTKPEWEILSYRFKADIDLDAEPDELDDNGFKKRKVFVRSVSDTADTFKIEEKDVLAIEHKAATQFAASMLNYYSKFEVMEDEIAKEIRDSLVGTKIGDWLMAVRGIGPILAGGLAAYIDISKSEHASSVWKYAGLAVDLDTGRAEHPIAGKPISYNPNLKTICWKIGESFVKVKGKYRTIYDTSKLSYQTKFPAIQEMKDENGKPVLSKAGKPIKLYTKGHIHAMSKRRAVKLFLADMYDFWRKSENLPVSIPFAHRIANTQEAAE